MANTLRHCHLHGIFRDGDDGGRIGGGIPVDIDDRVRLCWRSGIKQEIDDRKGMYCCGER